MLLEATSGCIGCSRKSKQGFEKSKALSTEEPGFRPPGCSRHGSAFGRGSWTNHRAERQARADELAGPGHHLIGVHWIGVIDSVGRCVRRVRKLRKQRTGGSRHWGCVAGFVLPNLKVLN